MKSCLSILICTIVFLPARSQEGYNYVGENKFTNIDGFNIDQFKNIYLISGSELKKIDSRGKEVYSYANPLLGNVSQVEVLNPLNPYIFYKDYNQLVMVDNRLNSSIAVNFADYGFLDIQFISFSDQDNVWFYDQATDKLYRFNIQKKKVTNESVNITQLSGGENFPAGMQSTIDKIYLNIPAKGIFMFDAVGAYQKTIPIKNVSSFDVYGSDIYALVEDQVWRYQLNTAQLTPLIFKEENLRSIKVSGNRLYFLVPDGIKIYRQSSGSED